MLAKILLLYLNSSKFNFLFEFFLLGKLILKLIYSSYKFVLFDVVVIILLQLTLLILLLLLLLLLLVLTENLSNYYFSFFF
jgi:hypothetical protein